MNQTDQPPKSSRGGYALNITLVAVAGQVGCLTLVIIMAALFGGLWLDSQLGTRPMFTITLMIVSIPITLFAMVWIVRKATSGIQSTAKSVKADDERGNDR